MKCPTFDRWALVGLTLFSLSCRQQNTDPGKSSTNDAEKKIQSSENHAAIHATTPLYQCPMHPQIIRKTPGDCPLCGMALVAVAEVQPQEAMSSAEAQAGSGPVGQGAPVIRLHADKLKTIGLRTQAVATRPWSPELRLDGVLILDPSRVSTLTARVSGYLEEVTSKIPGESIARGEILARLYSQEMIASQEEWLQSRRYRLSLDTQGNTRAAANAESLEASARRRLIHLGMSETALAKAEAQDSPERLFALSAPSATWSGVSRVLLERPVESGQAVQAGALLFRFADMGTLYAVGQVPQQSLGDLKLGAKVEVELPGQAGRRFPGTVTGMAPSLNPDTRTAEVRVAVRNTPDLALKPQMLVVLHVLSSQGARRVLAIPEQAVIRSGLRDLVLIRRESAAFQPREVVLGSSDKGWVEVKSGLREGEEIVTTSQFLIDSESNLRAAIDAMRAQDGTGR